MAEWSEALPMTAHCFPWFESWPGHVRKLPVTKDVVILFYRIFFFVLHLQQSGSVLTQIWQTCHDNRTSKSISLYEFPYFSVYD